MKTRVIIVHGYGGYPEKNWFPWLKAELEKHGIEVLVPRMPNTDAPKFKEWLAYLQQAVGEPNENTFLVGHSLGCPTVLRYLESLEPGKKIGGAILVAGFAEPIHLTELNDFVKPPWDDVHIREKTDNIILISSDNDEHLPLEMAERMRARFHAKLITLHNAGHINQNSGFTELPILLDELRKLIKF